MAEITVTPQEVDALGTHCKEQGGEVKRVMDNITAKIGATQWDSPAAKKFKGDWDGKFKRALTELAQALDELGTAAKTMAKNYDETERSYKGG